MFIFNSIKELQYLHAAFRKRSPARLKSGMREGGGQKRGGEVKMLRLFRFYKQESVRKRTSTTLTSIVVQYFASETRDRVAGQAKLTPLHTRRRYIYA